MKYALTVLAIFFLFVSAYGQEQDTTAGKTAIQKFSNRNGIILINEYVNLGELKASSWLAKPVKLEALKITAASDGSHQVGLRIKLPNPIKDRDEVITFLDLSEVKSLVEGLQFMQSQVTLWKGKTINYTEIHYNTLDDFECGVYKSKDEVKMFFEINRYPYPSAYFDEESIPAIIKILTSAITAMETLDNVAAK